MRPAGKEGEPGRATGAQDATRHLPGGTHERSGPQPAAGAVPVKLRVSRRRAPVYNVTVRSKSGRVLNPISGSPLTGGLVYGRKARREALGRAAADRDIEVVSVVRRSRGDSRIVRQAAREVRRARGSDRREAWDTGPDAYRGGPPRRSR
jgi:hypothetical protein